MVRGRQSFTLFLDESGNTGGNLLDERQPYFVAAGFGLASSNLEPARKIVVDWERTASRVGGELKSTTLLRKKSGRLRIFDLISQLGRAGAIPTYCLVEKPFAVCAKYLEAVLDAAYNPLVNQQVIEKKYDYADEIYQVTPATLRQEFYEAIVRKDEQKLSGSLDQFESLSKYCRTHELLDLIRACPRKMALQDLLGQDKPDLSLHYPALLALVAKFEDVMREVGATAWDIEFDENDFEEMLSWVVQRLKGGIADYWVEEFGSPLPRGRYLISGIRFGDSSKEPLIRAADYYSGMMRFLLENRNSLKPDREELEVLKLHLVPFLKFLHPSLNVPTFFNFTLSSATIIDVLALQGMVKRRAASG